MTSTLTSEFVRVGRFVAEVPVRLRLDVGDWSPCLSLEDARRIERVRAWLAAGDLAAASGEAAVYELRTEPPVAAHAP